MMGNIPLPESLRMTPSGHVFVSPEDDPEGMVRALLAIDYKEEFCIAADFSPTFISALMYAGFLVMSMDTGNSGSSVPGGEQALLLPKLHRERSVLFFPRLHAGRTLRRLCPRYELRADTDFEEILSGCIETHGEDWLTPPLVRGIRAIHGGKRGGELGSGSGQAEGKAWGNDRGNEAVSIRTFALHREGRLVAGEFGVSAGGVYTSYSGFYREDSAGSVQMALTGMWLRDRGFAFWDLGMPLDYKYALGAEDMGREEFLELFWQKRGESPGTDPS